MNFIKKELRDVFLFFGYTNDPESDDKNTQTSFFKYAKESFSDDEKKSYMGFKRRN